MSSVAFQGIPASFELAVIASSDTNAITIVSGVTGKKVQIWGCVLSGGTSILWKSNSTALSGVIPSGMLVLPPVGNPMSGAAPLYESASGEAITITPGASGLNGTVYYTQR